MKVSDRITGLMLIGLGAAAYYGGSLLPPVPGQQVGPNVFPMVVGGGLALCGALIALGVGSAIEREAEAELAAHADPAAAAAKPGSPAVNAFKTLLPALLLVFYVFAVERIGFPLTGAIVVGATSLVMGARLGLALPLAVVAPLVIHFVFLKILRVPLPAGFVPLPW